MPSSLSEDLRRKIRWSLIWGLFATLVFGVFFLGILDLKLNPNLKKYLPDLKDKPSYEVFGFAPYWTLSKLDNVDWDTLTTFAYFSLPINSDGTIDKNSYEWQTFQGEKLEGLFAKAKAHDVRRVVTITQMDATVIETFLNNTDFWNKLADESIDVVKSKNLDGVNIDFEYIPRNDALREKFSQFVDYYSMRLRENMDKSYITVSVLASSERFNKIYDISSLSKSADAIFMMAYDFFTPRSGIIGPSAPLYGFNSGRGPYWYDVSTAVDDFLKVAPANKIIMGVPYYGWNFPAASPAPNTSKSLGLAAFATTLEKVSANQLLQTTPIGGWDDLAKVSWRGYWDSNSWHVFFIEDAKSLSYKYDFAKSKNLAGVGLWALGYDSADNSLWPMLREKFAQNEHFSASIVKPWGSL